MAIAMSDDEESGPHHCCGRGSLTAWGSSRSTGRRQTDAGAGLAANAPLRVKSP